jgi:hypothetical protein
MDLTLSPEQARELTADLSALSKLQSAALQGAAYIRMSAAEAKEYDQRCIRIGEICAELVKFRPRSQNGSELYGSQFQTFSTLF